MCDKVSKLIKAEMKTETLLLPLLLLRKVAEEQYNKVRYVREKIHSNDVTSNEVLKN